RRRRVDVGIERDVVPPEQDVVGAKRLSVRPLQPLAQGERKLRAAWIELPLLGQTWSDRVLRVARPAQNGVVIFTPVRVKVGRTGPGQAPGAAVLADLLDR